MDEPIQVKKFEQIVLSQNKVSHWLSDFFAFWTEWKIRNTAKSVAQWAGNKQVFGRLAATFDDLVSLDEYEALMAENARLLERVELGDAAQAALEEEKKKNKVLRKDLRTARKEVKDVTEGARELLFLLQQTPEQVEQMAERETDQLQKNIREMTRERNALSRKKSKVAKVTALSAAVARKQD